jgi:hypothetical protein
MNNSPNPSAPLGATCDSSCVDGVQTCSYCLINSVAPAPGFSSNCDLTGTFSCTCPSAPTLECL